jgi:hypothetical protein
MRKQPGVITQKDDPHFAAVIAFNTETKKEAETIISKESLVSRGIYLVNGMGCDDCHTPKKMGLRSPEPDMEYRFPGQLANSLSGPADSNVLKKGWLMFNMDLTTFAGPWGTSYSANISSDNTGIGEWKEEQFIKAIRQGKYKGMDESRPLLPPMPWQNYSKLNDTDLKAIFAYLKTSKPIANVVPGPKPPGQY